MITEKDLSEYCIDNGVIKEDITGENLLIGKLLVDSDNIPYFYETKGGFKITPLGPYKSIFGVSDERRTNNLVVSNFYEGFLKLRSKMNRGDSVDSRIIIDPCGFGYGPIQDPTRESPRVFLAVSLQSRLKSATIYFTLIRGGCDDKPSYQANVCSFSTLDIMDVMEPYLSINAEKRAFIPFRLESK